MSERNILPTYPIPTRYKLSIKPNIHTNIFEGNVVISFASVVNTTASETSDTSAVHAITLNAAELTFTQVSFRYAGSGQQLPITVDRVTFDKDNQRATIPLPSAFTHPTELSIKYTGIIQSNMTGLYKSTYIVHERTPGQDNVNEQSGKEEVMLVTQMCPVDARKVLPCWDEPARKAIFEVTLISPSNMMALSNMPCLQRCFRNDNTTEWHFAPTPPMSTYLLAFVMAKLSYIEGRVKKTFPVSQTLEDKHFICNNNNNNDDGKEEEKHKNENHEENNKTAETIVRVYMLPGKERNAEFALHIACNVLPMYEQFFESNYQLPKMDMIATPSFAFGAMENWGCITYRERLLFNSEDTLPENKHECAIVVAHEIAHQWFGNLVTMEWWKELWLNESFATFIATWAIHNLYPEWEMDVNYLYTECSRALELDALRTSHPIEVDLRNAQEIDGIFDAISYAKGGSVLRMVERYIGAKSFQKGLALYLHRHAFRNATTVDLWDALSEVHGSDLRAMLRCWTNQQGFPFLEVSRNTHDECSITSRVNETRCNTLHIKQRRFTLQKEVTTTTTTTNSTPPHDSNDNSSNNCTQHKNTPESNGNEQPLWYIPLVITIGHGTPLVKEVKDTSVALNTEVTMSKSSSSETTSVIRHVLQPSSQSVITLPDHEPCEWVNVNTDRTAFCRVLYLDESLLSSLLQRVRTKELSAMDRLTLLSDYHTFARGGYCTTSTVLNMLTYYSNEDDVTVWKVIVEFLNTVQKMLLSSHGNDTVVKLFNDFYLQLCKAVLDKIGLTGIDATNTSTEGNTASCTSTTTPTVALLKKEKDNTRSLRSLLVENMIGLNDSQLQQKMTDLYNNKDNTPIPTDIEYSVYRYVIQKGNESALESVQKEIKSTSNPIRKTSLLRLLPLSNVEQSTEKIMEYVLSDACQGQDALYIFEGFATNPLNYVKFIHELMRRWPEIAHKLPGVMQGRSLKLIGYGFDDTVASELRSFWYALPESTQSSTRASFEQGMENLMINAAWVKRDLQDITQFILLQNQKK